MYTRRKKRYLTNASPEIFEFYNCKHLYDHTAVQPTLMCWNNVHGFQTEDGTLYACADMRIWGARAQNIVVKCATQGVYQDMIDNMEDTSRILDIMNHTYSAHNVRLPWRGDRFPATYRFHVPSEDYEKDFNMNSWVDFMSEEI